MLVPLLQILDCTDPRQAGAKPDSSAEEDLRTCSVGSYDTWNSESKQILRVDWRESFSSLRVEILCIFLLNSEGIACYFILLIELCDSCKLEVF